MTEPARQQTESPRVLMVGKGWFPEQTGGLDRYFRALLEQLPEARAVVLGAKDVVAGERVRTVSAHDRPLPARLWSLTRVIHREAREAAIIDVHFALYAFVPLLLGARRGKPLVVHFHGPWADENVESGDSSTWRLMLRRALERYVYRRATVAITLTESFKRVLVERYGLSPERVRVLAPGVDLVRFSPGDRAVARGRMSIPADAFVVCCARRLVPRMGFDVLLKAWSDILAIHERDETSRPFRLLIAGDGELRGAIAAAIAEGMLADSVALLGRVTDDELAELYRAADVNVVPSLAHEGFGLVVLEAAASGTPTVATRVGGLPEALAGLDATLIVEPDDPTALAGRLIDAANGALPGRLRSRTWAAQHRWNRVAEQHRELYRRLPRDVRSDGGRF